VFSGSCDTSIGPCFSCLSTNYYQCVPPQGMACYLTGSCNYNGVFNSPCPCDCSVLTTTASTTALTGDAAGACANVCPTGFVCRYSGQTATAAPVAEAASDSTQKTMLGATFGLLAAIYIAGAILQKLATPSTSAATSSLEESLLDVDSSGSSGNVNSGYDGKLELSAEEWKCPAFGENKRVWLAATIFGIFNTRGRQRYLRVFLAAGHPLLTVIYNENTRKFGLSDANAADAMPKMRRLRMGSLLAVLCISLALSVVVAQITLPGVTSKADVECYDPVNPGNSVSSLTQSQSSSGTVATSQSTSAAVIVAVISIVSGIAMGMITDAVVVAQQRRWACYSFAQTLAAILLVAVGVGWAILSATVCHRSGTQIALYVYVVAVSTITSWIAVANISNFVKWCLGKLLAGSYNVGKAEAEA
jgi:hypothetical protein